MTEAKPANIAVPREVNTPPWLGHVLPPLASFVLFVAVWQGIIVAAQLKSYVLPGPLAVIGAVIEHSSSLSESALFTFQASFVAFLVVMVLGTVIAFVLASSKFIEQAFYPYAVMLQSTPVIAIAPIIIIWFGFGFTSIVTISVIIAIFAVVANTTQGLISVENNLQNLFKLYGANKPQTLLKLRLPFALPFMVTGWRIAAAQVVIGVIVGEYMAGAGGGGMGGLGLIIAETSARLQTAYLFAAALCAALLGIGFFLVVNLFGHLLLKNWHESAIQFEN